MTTIDVFERRAINEYNRIRNTLGPNDRIELEARLFSGDVTEQAFNRIRAYAMSPSSGYNSPSPATNSTAIVWDETRIIQTKDSTYAERKTQPITPYNSSSKGYKYRISLSAERSIPVPPIPKFALRRNRTRESFAHSSMPFTLDLTIVTDDSKANRGVTYEVELEANFSSTQPIVQGVVDRLQSLFMQLPIFGNMQAVPIAQYDAAVREYNTLTRFNHKSGINFPPSKPVDATYAFFRWEVVHNYAITMKADGVRCVLFLRKQNEVYSIANDVKLLKDVHIEHASDDQTRFPIVLDCEFVPDINTFYAFDCIVYGGTYLDSLPGQSQLLQRVQMADSVRFSQSHNGGFNYAIKPYVSCDSVPDYLAAIHQYRSMSETGIPYKVDGVIFQHLSIIGDAKKWKPPELLTIDFAVTKYPPYIGVNVSGAGGSSIVSASDVIGNLNNASIPKDVVEGKIAEFKWDYDQKRFIFYRTRDDKQYSNNKETVRAVFNLITNPITYETISLQNLVLTRKYHNREKSEAYANLKEDGAKTILDVGSGTGGDVQKWKANGFTHVTAIEVNPDNYKRLVERIRDEGMTSIVTPVNTSILDYEDDTKYDAITMFNSLTFFGKNTSTLRNLFIKLDKMLKVGGHLFAMFVDSSKFETNFPRPEYISPQISVTYLHPPPNNEINISINASGIVTQQHEYLVDQSVVDDVLLKQLGNYDIHSDKYLNKESLQSLDGKKLSQSTVARSWYKDHERDVENELENGDWYEVIDDRRYPNVIVHQSNTTLIGAILGAIYAPYIAASVMQRDNMVEDVAMALGIPSTSTNMLTIGNALSIGIKYKNNMVTIPQSGDYVTLATQEISPNEYFVMGVYNPDQNKVITVMNVNANVTT